MRKLAPLELIGFHPLPNQLRGSISHCRASVRGSLRCEISTQLTSAGVQKRRPVWPTASILKKTRTQASFGTEPSGTQSNRLRGSTRRGCQKLIENTHKRLARVQIECLPYQDILRRYDRPGTLYYLDPPYFGLKLYRYNFSENDFTELAACLKKLQGKFVLSLNDVPQVRRIFAYFKFLEIELPYTAQRKAGKRFRELLIANFPLRDRGSK